MGIYTEKRDQLIEKIKGLEKRIASDTAKKKTLEDKLKEASRLAMAEEYNCKPRKLYYVHVICTPGLTYYALSEKRGTKAMEEIGFLEKYQGIVVHDFWMSYFKATGASHDMCCAHLLRELTGIYENHPEQEWARKLYFELLSMCCAADFLISIRILIHGIITWNA